MSANNTSSASTEPAPKRAKPTKQKKPFGWKSLTAEPAAARAAEDPEADEPTSKEQETKELWIERLTDAMRAKRVQLFVSSDILCDMTGKPSADHLPVSFNSMALCTYDELWEPIYRGLTEWKSGRSAEHVAFRAPFKELGEKDFYMDLVDHSVMTICYANER